MGVPDPNKLNEVTYDDFFSWGDHRLLEVDPQIWDVIMFHTHAKKTTTKRII